MQQYVKEYLVNTILFFGITIIWNLVEGTPLQWLSLITQSLIFGIILTIITVQYSKRKKKKHGNPSD